MNWLLIVYAGVIGACIGSFLNVCIYRWPAEQSVLRPRSRCPQCENSIAWYDNLPILSWIILRARCRYCGAPIAAQYPMVELVCAVVWAAAAARFGFSITALHSATFLTILLGIAMTDAREMVIPDQFTLGGTVLGLGFAAFPGGLAFLTALIGAVSAYAFFWAGKWAAEDPGLLRSPGDK
ncbi:MAG: prepilin peptidase, partial [Gemmatimonadota bacterium]